MGKLLFPQEIEVFYVFPALRRELASFMKLDGKSQKEIARLLGVTEPAVSQYMSSKRAGLLQFSDELKSSIRSSSKKIVDSHSLLREMQVLLHIVRKSGVLCSLHESVGGAPKNCNACFDVVSIK